MSVISFSGLSTGLDTSSWVSALTALKNAKVESLQDQRTSVNTLRDSVAGIKTFFTSFRNSLERLTDAKFNVKTMDIFAQNLANSSNPSKVTAQATVEASRDKYEVSVSQVASATKVDTSVRDTVTVSHTAGLNTKLDTLGVENGYVSLNNKELQIVDGDTIKSLIQKMGDIGVFATYDEDKGVFSISADIWEADQGTTKLFDTFGLSFKQVSGEESVRLMTEGYVQITANTKLSDIGVTNGDIVINDETKTLNFGANDTVQTLLNVLNSNYGNGTASIDANGVVTITGLDINEVAGGSNILSALGLTETVDSILSETSNLTYEKEQLITLDTKLGDINTEFPNYELIMQVEGGGAMSHRHCVCDLYAA